MFQNTIAHALSIQPILTLMCLESVPIQCNWLCRGFYMYILKVGVLEYYFEDRVGVFVTLAVKSGTNLGPETLRICR